MVVGVDWMEGEMGHRCVKEENSVMRDISMAAFRSVSSNVTRRWSVLILCLNANNGMGAMGVVAAHFC